MRKLTQKKLINISKKIEQLNNIYPLKIDTLMDVSKCIAKAIKNLENLSCKEYRTDGICTNCNCWKLNNQKN